MRFAIPIGLSLTVAFVARTAQAHCASATECICHAAAPTVATAHVTATSGPKTTVAIDSVLPGTTADGGAPPSTLVIPAEEGDVAGRKMILGVDGSLVAGRLDVQADGTVTCRFLAPDTHIARDAVIAALQASDCDSAVLAAGFVQPPCHDTGSCASVGGSPMAALLLLAMFGWTRRRRSAG